MLPKILVIVLLLIYSAGLFLGGVVWQKKNSPDKSRTLLSNLNDPKSAAYANLTGSINGKVTKVEGEKVYIEPKKGGQAIFSLAPNLIVSEIKNGQVKELGTKNAIQLNRPMTLVIKGFNNGFAATSITYTPDAFTLTGQMKELNK